jgi:hypothetical protein
VIVHRQRLVEDTAEGGGVQPHVLGGEGAETIIFEELSLPLEIRSMSPKGLCENTLPIISQGKESSKGKGRSSAEERGYFFYRMLVAVGSKLVQEGEKDSKLLQPG